MHFSSDKIANAVAWGILIGLISVVIAVVAILGPFGLVVLGLITLFICTSLKLNDDVPTRSVEVFKAQINKPGSPEQRAAMREEKRNRLMPLHFYRRCGVVLLVAGLAGFAWQYSG